MNIHNRTSYIRILGIEESYQHEVNQCPHNVNGRGIFSFSPKIINARILDKLVVDGYLFNGM